MNTLRAKLTLFALGASVVAMAALRPDGPRWYPEVDRVCEKSSRRGADGAYQSTCGVERRLLESYHMNFPGPGGFPEGPAVVAVGDSFTFGTGVEQSWAEILGVVNAGQYGANAADIAATVRRFFVPTPFAPHLAHGADADLVEAAMPTSLDSGYRGREWPTEPSRFLWLVWPNDVLGSWEDGSDARRGEGMRAFLGRRYRERGEDVARDFAEVGRMAGSVPVVAAVAWYATDPEWWLLDAIEQDLRDAGVTVLPRVLGMPLASNEFHFNAESHRLVAERFREGMDG